MIWDGYWTSGNEIALESLSLNFRLVLEIIFFWIEILFFALKGNSARIEKWMSLVLSLTVENFDFPISKLLIMGSWKFLCIL